MTPHPQSQPKKADAPPICCYCDNDLSCGTCGREQPYDDISVLKSRIEELEGVLQKIADQPDHGNPQTPIKRTPRQIAIAALKGAA